MANQAPRWIQQAREHWTNTGAERPAFAIEPGPDQESAWDYPRPPAVVTDDRPIEVDGPNGRIAQSSSSVRILETSHPPTFYLPPDALVAGALDVLPGSSHCEWKGTAEYLALPNTALAVGWRYPDPYEEFEPWASWMSFYPAMVDCLIAGERVRPQPGGFYGGWITDDVVGPFKGEPGTAGW